MKSLISPISMINILKSGDVTLKEGVIDYNEAFDEIAPIKMLKLGNQYNSFAIDKVVNDLLEAGKFRVMLDGKFICNLGEISAKCRVIDNALDQSNVIFETPQELLDVLKAGFSVYKPETVGSKKLRVLLHPNEVLKVSFEKDKKWSWAVLVASVVEKEINDLVNWVPRGSRFDLTEIAIDKKVFIPVNPAKDLEHAFDGEESIDSIDLLKNYTSLYLEPILNEYVTPFIRENGLWMYYVVDIDTNYNITVVMYNDIRILDWWSDRLEEKNREEERRRENGE